jgi:tetratricopeptide (TPR) repeat protein
MTTSRTTNTIYRQLLILLIVCVLTVCAVFIYRNAIAESLVDQGFPNIAFMLSPDSPETCLKIGAVFFSGDAYSQIKAEDAYRRALMLDPNIKTAHYQLGRIYFLKGEFEKALEHVNSEITLNPEFSKSYYVRGLILGFLKRYDEAGTSFLTYIEQDPINWAAYNDLAWILFQQGRYEESESIARIGLDYTSGNPWLQNSIGTALLSQGKYKEAHEFFVQAYGGFYEITDAQWGEAYPGNDPNMYPAGRSATIDSVGENIRITLEKIQ